MVTMNGFPSFATLLTHSIDLLPMMLALYPACSPPLELA